MKRFVFAAAILAIGVSQPFAQSDVAKERNQFMYQLGESAYSVLGRMSKGEQPYDQAKVDAAFAKIGEIAPKLPPLWPAGSEKTAEGSDYHSSSKIWQQKADFDARLAKFIKDQGEYRSKVTNLDTLKVAYEAVVTQDCNGCHREYRLRNR